MPGIFICYRNIGRSYAPMLVDRELCRRFGPANVFQAGRSILPGKDLAGEIGRWLERCSVLIALIDKPWAGQDLDLLRDPGDWVRHEISYALGHGKEVLPLLLDGTPMPSGRALPPDIAPLTRQIALRMDPRTADADLLRLTGRVESLAPDLVLATLTDLPFPAPDPAHPTALLRAEHEVAAFRPRPELSRLAGWCTSHSGPRVRLVTGPGGTGKTRLALRLTARLRGLGWVAGLLSASAPPAALDQIGEIRTPCLVVIDDAETSPELVQAALRSVAAAPDAPARLLLLARSGSGWLSSLQDDQDDRLAALAGGIVPEPLEPLAAGEDEFGSVCAAYAGRLGLPVPPPAAGGPLAAGSMLELQAAALVHVLPAGTLTGSPLQRMLELERDYWRRAAQPFGLDLGSRQLAEIMAAVTLFGAGTEAEADALIGSLRAFHGRPADAVDSCRDLLRTVLPGPAPLNPLPAGPIGEDAVAGFLRSGRSLSGSIAVVSDRQAARALVTLGQCLDRDPGLGPQVRAFLAEAPARLLPLAMTALAAVPRPELLVEQMSRAIDGLPEADLAGLASALPQRSEALARFAVTVTERALAAARRASAGPAVTAGLAWRFALRLAYLRERPAAAAAAAEEAIAQLTGLIAAGGDHQAELGEALAARAAALDLDSRAGDGALAAGRAAIAAYRALPAGARRDGALATALNNQAARLRRTRETGAARDQASQAARDLVTEAHRLTAPLSEERPGAFRSLHADVTDTLSVLLEQTGDPAGAERASRDALALRRLLAVSRPDAYRPQLAGTLFNLGLILSRHGGDRAEVHALWTEAAELYTALAAGWPGRFGEQRDRVARHLGSRGGADDD